MNLLGRIWPFFSEKECLRRVIEDKKDPLEILLSQALGPDQLIAVSVKNGKVYIGRLISSFNPAYGVQSLTLLRSYSGHRDRDTLAFHLDIDYERVLEEAVENLVTETGRRIRRENPDLSEEDLEERIEDELKEGNHQGEENEEIRSVVDQLHALKIVIPVSEIQSVNTFDATIYAAVSGEEQGDE